jgi:hypothetical protein
MAPEPDIPAVDIELYLLLMGISTETTHFRSNYDRALSVLEMVKVENRLATLFVTDHHKLVSAAIDHYRNSLEPLPHCQILQPGAELVSTLSETTSKQLFTAMFPIMKSLGFTRSTEPLDKLQDEVVIIAFLDWAVRDRVMFDKIKRSSNTLAEILIRISSAGVLEAEAAAPQGKAVETSADLELWQFSRRIIDGDVHFPSDYDRAHRLFTMCTDNADSMTNPFAVEYNRLLPLVIDRWSSPLKPPSRTFRPRPNAKLVDKLPESKSVRLFALLDKYMEMIGFPVTPGLPGTLIHQTVAVGLLSWIAKARHDTLEVLLPGIKILD